MATKIFVHCGGENEAYLSGETPDGEYFILVEKSAEGIFDIVGNNIVEDGDGNADDIELGFSGWSQEVVDLDAGWSDASSSFSISEKLLCGVVILTPDKVQADTIEQIVLVVRHVLFGKYCSGDI